MGSFKQNNEFFGHRIPDDCCILKDVDLLKVIKTEHPQFIMKKLTDEDPELPNRFKEENKVWQTKATDLDSISKKYNDVNLNMSEA